MPNRIIVSGIYRSGTSLNAELIHQWGAYAGREDDIFKDQYGYMEHLALQKLNDELLNNNSRVPTPVDQLLEKTQDATLRERALQILDAMDKEAEQNQTIAWVWKDPRLPLVLPFWSNIWGDVIYVIPVRHPVETILSAASMEGLSPEETPLSAGFVYWQFCMLNVLAFTGTAIPIVAFLNIRFSSVPPATVGTVMRQALWVGIYIPTLEWLRIPRVLSPSIALLVAAAFIVAEALLRVRERSQWRP